MQYLYKVSVVLERSKMRLFLIFFGLSLGAFAQQQPSIVTTAVPFLSIASDARSSGMGDVGIASSPDAFSMQWNPAKYVFLDSDRGVGLGYTPYLESIISDIALLSGYYYKKPNERSSFAVGLRYFTIGEIELRQFASDPGMITKPNEIAIDGSYALKLSPRFSMAVTGRYIRSNLKFPQEASIDSKAASSVAVDLSAFYLGTPKSYPGFDGRWRWGFNLSNLGPKIAYDASGQEDFLPANLGIGLGYDFIYGPQSSLAIQLDINKYLVPTPEDYNEDGRIDQADFNEFQSKDFISGIFDSFSDSPEGFADELKELRIGLGMEYSIRQIFAIRTGYFTEAERSGSRQFFTIGSGVSLKSFQIDLSYLFSTSNVRNPLENTLRFSLSFQLNSPKN